LLGGNELVARLCAEVLDVVDEEGVGEGVLGEEYYLGASRGKTFCYLSTDA
jgi:hypothetical protein